MKIRNARQSMPLILAAVILSVTAHTSALADSYSIVLINPPETIVVPEAINNAGQIVGRLAERPQQPGVLAQYRPFLYSNGVFRVLSDLGSTGEQFSTASGINNSGDVVGTFATDGFGQTRAFLDRNGQFRDLGTFGEARSFALDINDSGQIVGGTDAASFCLPDGVTIKYSSLPCLRFLITS